MPQFVPVGEDQVPHLELSREVVRRFNNFYGDVLVEPQPLLTTFPRLPGLDNRKMSKSYGNAIDLSDDAETVRKKVMAACTRTRSGSAPTSRAPSKAIRCSCTTTRSTPTRDEVEDLKSRYRAGKVGDVEVKTKLAAAMNAHARADARAPGATRSRAPGGSAEILFEGSARPAWSRRRRWSVCATRSSELP